MKVEVVTINACEKKIQFAVPPEEVGNKLDAAYRILRGRVRIPGFRPGKAPRQLLEQRYAPQVESDVAQNLVQDAYAGAMKEHSLQVVGEPKLEAGPLRGPDGFTFSVLVQVRPEIELAAYTGLPVEYPVAEVTEAEVDAAVKRRLESEQRLVEVTGRPAEATDLAIVQIDLRADGEADPVATEPGTALRLGGDPYYPGLEPLVIGLEIGATVSGEVTIGSAARSSAAGRTVTATVTLHSLQGQEVPTLTDELAEELGYVGGIDGMRASIEMSIRSSREDTARNQARANLLQVLIQHNPFTVPEGLINDQYKALIEELRMQHAYRGGDPKKLTFSEAQRRDLRMRAEFASKGGLILEYVCAREGIKITEDDLEQKYRELADERGQSVEAIRGYFVKDGAVEALRERMLEERTLDWLLERAELVYPGAAAAPAEAAPVDEAAAEAAPADASSTEG
jgi:trigger factor